MSKDQVVIEFESADELRKEVESNLCYGGAFARGGYSFIRGQDCELVLVHPENGRTLAFPALVSLVVLGGEKKGIGLIIKNFDQNIRKKIEMFAEQQASDTRNSKAGLDPVHERIRGLSSVEQQKMAHSRNLSERVALERMYGKLVWESLLRNSSITMPEVARIARMGNLPRPLLELIVSNNSWISTPHVRRALLSNPKLTGEMVSKVIRVMPKNELKLAKIQMSYSEAVRSAARRALTDRN